MELKMKIHNVKSITDFSMSFPLDNGLYAITGENATGLLFNAYVRLFW